jgi:hypothetical protein
MRDSAVIHFRRNMLVLAGRKINIRARRYNRVIGAAKIFSPSVLVTHQWMTAAFIASNGGRRYTPFRPNSMSIRPQAKRFSKD